MYSTKSLGGRASVCESERGYYYRLRVRLPLYFHQRFVYLLFSILSIQPIVTKKNIHNLITIEAPDDDDENVGRKIMEKWKRN
jgi:hypothetical protein